MHNVLASASRIAHSDMISMIAHNHIMMKSRHWQTSTRKKGFLGTTRLQIIYKLQFFSKCGLPNVSHSLPANLTRDRTSGLIQSISNSPSYLLQLLISGEYTHTHTQQTTKQNRSASPGMKETHIVPLVGCLASIYSRLFSV